MRGPLTAPRLRPSAGAVALLAGLFGLAGLSGVGCARRTIPANDPGVRATAPASVSSESGRRTSGSGEGLLDADRARAEAQRILTEVAQARNLEVTKNVKVDVIDREGIRAFSKASMYEETTPEELRRAGRIESSLGVIPVGADPEQVLLDLLEEGVLGLYDPKSKTLLIGDFVPTVMLAMVVGHEIAHGLQDMHFDLETVRKPLDHRGDQEAARTFLIEGGAQAAYLAWVSGEAGLQSIDDAVLDAMGNQTLELSGEMNPYPILSRSLQMPYADGTATVVRLVLAKGGWGAVDALYRDLPASSEQMLHLDKLLNREPVVPVVLEASEIESVLGLESIWHDQVGEAALLSMLAEVEPSVTARQAAAGWGGDMLLAFDRKDAPLQVPVVVAAIAWDTKRDAQEFETSFAKYLDQVVKEGTFLARDGDMVVFGTRVPEGIDPKTVAQAARKAARVQRAPKRGKKAPKSSSKPRKDGGSR